MGTPFEMARSDVAVHTRTRTRTCNDDDDILTLQIRSSVAKDSRYIIQAE